MSFPDQAVGKKPFEITTYSKLILDTSGKKKLDVQKSAFNIVEGGVQHRIEGLC